MKTYTEKLILAIVIFLFALLVFGSLGGCAGIKPPSVVPLHPVPPNLAPEGHILTFTFGLGLGGIIAGVVMYFLIPEQHRISYALIGGGGAGLGLSVLLKTSLWFIPYIALAVAIFGVLVLIYEVYVHYIRKPA